MLTVATGHINCGKLLTDVKPWSDVPTLRAIQRMNLMSKPKIAIFQTAYRNE
jgi:hypothetical protein